MAQQVEPLSVDTWSVSSSSLLNINHKWTIENFSYHCKKPTGTRLESSVFCSPKGNNEYRWRLTIYPNGLDLYSRCTIYLFCLMEDTKPHVLAQVKLHVLDTNNTKTNSTEVSHIFTPNSKCDMNCPYKTKILNNSALLLPDDKLTIFCEIIILDEIDVISEKPIEIKVLEYPMNNDFGLLLESQNLNDVTFTVSGKHIRAHKAILAARSPVFLAMFEHDMKEQQTNHVDITDIDHEVFEEMLRFIYTNQAPNLEKMAKKLLAAADKYSLEGLKSMCVKGLHKSLSVINVVDILVLAYLHNSEQLKALAINFFCKNMKYVVETGTFKLLFSSHPDLMMEVLGVVGAKVVEPRFPMA